MNTGEEIVEEEKYSLREWMLAKKENNEENQFNKSQGGMEFQGQRMLHRN